MKGFQGIRPPAVAGQFYPDDPGRLKAAVQDCLAAGARPTAAERAPVRALIVPHAGYQFSGPTAGKGYALLCDAAAPHHSRCLVLAPSHRSWFRGLGIGAFAAYETPLGAVPVDEATCRQLISAHGLIADRPDVHAHEHALEVHLPFVHTVLPEATLVPIVCGEMRLEEIREVGAILARQLWLPNTLWIVSSDFTHYGRSFGYVPFTHDVPKRLEELDQGAIDRILDADCAGFLQYVEQTGATVCGRIPIALLLAALESIAAEVDLRLIDYTTSGALTHDYRHTVSYATLAVRDRATAPTEHSDFLAESEKNLLLHLARETLRCSFGSVSIRVPETVLASPRLTADGAVFVTLKHCGRLRGCVGCLEAVEPLYESVIRYTKSAAFHDSRFHPLAEEELNKITIEISVLTPPRPVAGPDEIEIGRHGIVLEKRGRRAVFLPQVPVEEHWDLETTLQYLAMKAGLGPDEWRRGTRFSVFEAVVFGEPQL
ncbi:MAG: AmmeMemoRadiSam system protein B [Kiritimatiellaeota bacterium]|nr:AmmeMemoRadiSam system protein B [Kiritimatiellota bacterium]